MRVTTNSENMTSLATSLPVAQWLERPTGVRERGHGFDSQINKNNKAKEDPQEDTKLANLTKVTRILPATAKCLLTKITNIARITNLAKKTKGK